MCFFFSFCLHCSSENISNNFGIREGTSGGVWISNVKKSNTFGVKSINAIRYSTKSRQTECIHRNRLMAMNISNEQQDHVDSLSVYSEWLSVFVGCWNFSLHAIDIWCWNHSYPMKVDNYIELLAFHSPSILLYHFGKCIAL